MVTLYWWAISAIAGSILGSATSTWFEKTKMGKWFYAKMESFYNWAANRYGLEILKSQEKWRAQYPALAKKVDELENRINDLEKPEVDFGDMGEMK